MQDIYAVPRHITSLDECWFYHTTDVPGLGTVPGDWDLRGRVDAYLGGIDLKGKRVLELGTASGFLCFEMETRGAEMVVFDLAPGLPPDVLPFAGHYNLGELITGLDGLMEKLRNSFWLCHRLRESKAKVVYGSIYDLPAGIGPVDVATFGSILLHLRDPFLALANAARFARESMVVTDLFHGNEWDARLLGSEYFSPMPPSLEAPSGFVQRFVQSVSKRQESLPPASVPTVPAMAFLPDPADKTLIHRMNSWWQFTPAVIQRYLGVLGFEESTVTMHTQKFQNGTPVRLFTVVARRTQPMPKRMDGPYPWY